MIRRIAITDRITIGGQPTIKTKRITVLSLFCLALMTGCANINQPEQVPDEDSPAVEAPPPAGMEVNPAQPETERPGN